MGNVFSKVTRTSDEWQKSYPKIVVLDPDGWDRKNWDHSWFKERITYEEYVRRVSESTCIHTVKK